MADAQEKKTDNWAEMSDHEEHEEQAEEQKAQELEKQIAMMELDPGLVIMPPPPLPTLPDDSFQRTDSRAPKPVLPYTSMFFLTSDNQ